MTVSNADIWKSVAATSRPTTASGDRNLHIGETLKGLYYAGSGHAADARFDDLLEALDASEEHSERH